MKNEFIPHLISIGNLTAGFFSLLFTIRGKFTEAAFIIMLSMLLDGIDGIIARKLKVQSQFGKEMDSLSDIVSFGITPAILIFLFYFGQNEFIGLFAVIPYIICASLRLAKFNLQPFKSHFSGLPITIAGGFLTSFVIGNIKFSPYLLTIIIIFLSYLMLSPICYPKFEYIVFHIMNYYKLFLLLSASVFILFINPKKLVFLPLLVYIAYGIKIRVLAKIKNIKSNNMIVDQKPE